MVFDHDFRADLLKLLAAVDSGEPFAFARFADGEKALLTGNPVITADGWSVPSLPTAFINALGESLLYDADDFYLGLGCPCCDADTHGFLMDRRRIPVEKCTFSNLFVNANHDVFCAWAERHDFVLASSSRRSPVSLRVPENVVNFEWNIDDLVDCICQQEVGPILVAAGPASSIIIQRYWQRASHRRAIIDVGSALDPMIHERSTRLYQEPDHPDRRKVCTWTSL